jgi:hypothetical protein
VMNRIAFRFCFTYFGLYTLATQIGGSLILIPFVSFRGLGLLWPMREITVWVGEHIFHTTSSLVFTGNSRDTDFFWIQTFWLLIVAIAATAVWSVLDRRREDYPTLQKWFRVFIRLAVASQMFEYGMTKVIPVQFPAPSLITLVTPVGNLSRQGLLWTFIGASPAYEIATGCAELVAGILLLVPRTAMLGALVAFADMAQVFVLNMTYDVGVKLVSFHLLMMSLFLLVSSTRTDLFRSAGANRIAVALQIVLGVYMLAMQADVNWVYWYREGGGAPKSALYGIWDIEQLSVDGQVRPAVLNDYDRRWRRAIFDAPDSMAFQRTDDSFAHYGAFIDSRNRTLALTKGRSRKWRADFTFERPAEDRLILDGEMDGYKIRMQLQLVNFDTFRILNSGFRWVRPPDP